MAGRPRLQQRRAVHRRHHRRQPDRQVDQRPTGGQWRILGTFTLAAGDANKVGVSRWTCGTGYVIADAVRVTRV